MAAAAGRITSVDTVWTDVKDEDGLQAEAVAMRTLGFGGKLAIHPRQVPIITAAFSPTEEEVEKARRIVEAFEAAGTGVVNVDGRMIDAPIVERARRVLAMANGA
ncbi:MAG: HpcH/HpaI aldolase/citrate lyase family protein, partial [bacterium]